jgi:hypothetical protein
MLLKETTEKSVIEFRHGLANKVGQRAVLNVSSSWTIPFSHKARLVPAVNNRVGQRLPGKPTTRMKRSIDDGSFPRINTSVNETECNLLHRLDVVSLCRA